MLPGPGFPGILGADLDATTGVGQVCQGARAHLLEGRTSASIASSSSTDWSRMTMFQLTTVIMTSASAEPVAGPAGPAYSGNT